MDAHAVVLVEGVSDRIAIETIAAAQARDLASERVAVVAINGAQAIGRVLAEVGDGRTRVLGVCDAAEEPLWHRARLAAGLEATFEFFVCRADLEDELIRAVSPARVVESFAAHGDLGAFRTMQKQAPWRDRPVAAQMRRFLGSGATRKVRYAAVLGAAAVELDRVPGPLAAVLSASCSGGGGRGVRAPARRAGR